MAKISAITFYWKDNYVQYDTDYHNAYSLSLKATIEWIIESGADTITTRTVNNDTKIPTLRRVKQISKKAGYTYEDKSHTHHYHTQNTDEYIIEFELRRVKPSI